MWSILVPGAIIMEGYDIVLINSFFAQEAFRRKYGVYFAGTDSYQITAAWQTGFSSAESSLAYRIPFAIQWARPLPLFVILYSAPESPWHHVRTGNHDAAERSVIRLSSKSQHADAKNTVAMMIIWLGVYYLTVGPVCYAIVSEVSSVRLRNKSVCLARVAYYIAQITCNVVNPYMLNPTAAGWGGKTGFFWDVCPLVFFAWTWFRLPETKDETFEELDLLFARGVGARKFEVAKMDARSTERAWLSWRLVRLVVGSLL